MYGLGFCHQTNQYKVVRIRYTSPSLFNPGARYWKAEVYCLGTSSTGWRSIDGGVPQDWIFCHHNVWLNGSLYWLIQPMHIIYAFDFETEQFRAIPLSPLRPATDSRCNIGVFRDSIYFCYQRSESMFEVWLLNEDDDTVELWSKIFDIESPPRVSLGPLPIRILHNGDVFIFSDDIVERFLLLNRTQGTCSSWPLGHLHVIDYHPSFVSLKNLMGELRDSSTQILNANSGINHSTCQDRKSLQQQHPDSIQGQQLRF